MPATRKATDLTRKTLFAEVAIKGTRREEQNETVHNWRSGCMSQAEGMLQEARNRGPEPQPASSNAAEA